MAVYFLLFFTLFGFGLDFITIFFSLGFGPPVWCISKNHKKASITKIEIKRNDALKQRVFPAGWDPLDGYPARP